MNTLLLEGLVESLSCFKGYEILNTLRIILGVQSF